MQNEDYMLDEEYNVESFSNFMNDKNEEEEYFIRDYMKPCKNCGELRPKDDLRQYNGLCYLCSKSPYHENTRGADSTASENFHSIEQLLNEWDNQEEY